MADYAEDQPEMASAAVTVAQIVTVFGMLQLGLNEKEAVSQFGKVFRSVRRRSNKLGKDARLSDVLTEMHLDQRPEKRR